MGTRFKTESKDPAVNVTTWVLLVVVILSVSARLGTKFNLFRKLTVDDLLMVGSLVRIPTFCLTWVFSELWDLTSLLLGILHCPKYNHIYGCCLWVWQTLQGCNWCWIWSNYESEPMFPYSMACTIFESLLTACLLWSIYMPDQFSTLLDLPFQSFRSPFSFAVWRRLQKTEYMLVLSRGLFAPGLLRQSSVLLSNALHHEIGISGMENASMRYIFLVFVLTAGERLKLIISSTDGMVFLRDYLQHSYWSHNLCSSNDPHFQYPDFN